MQTCIEYNAETSVHDGLRTVLVSGNLMFSITAFETNIATATYKVK